MTDGLTLAIPFRVLGEALRNSSGIFLGNAPIISVEFLFLNFELLLRKSLYRAYHELP
jgi:hypothetical protein